MEEEIFGFPVTRHPLELVAADPAPGPLPAGGAREGAAGGSRGLPLVTAERMALFAGRRVRMRGLAISYKRIPVRKGRGWMKFLSLEDLTRRSTRGTRRTPSAPAPTCSRGASSSTTGCRR
jgi:hypothetical protein